MGEIVAPSGGIPKLDSGATRQIVEINHKPILYEPNTKGKSEKQTI